VKGVLTLMKSYTSDKIRNIVVMGHGGSGKTSLLEMFLYRSGVSSRLGSIDQGTSMCNYDPEELKRLTTVSMKLVPIEWNSSKINFIDTPGYADFIGEILCGVRGADSGLIMINAVAGIEVQAQKAWRILSELEMPRGFVLNKCDREGVKFESAVSNIKNTFSKKAVLLHLPIGIGPDFRGIIDILSGKAYFYEGEKSVEKEVPPELKDRVNELRTEITESAVESDDSLMEKYLEGGEVTSEELDKALRSAILKSELYPIFCSASTKNIGGNELLNSLTEVFPVSSELPPVKAKDKDNNEIEVKIDSNAPLTAFVFKNISEPQLGELALLKIISGKLVAGMELQNTVQSGSERMGHLLMIRAKNREEVSEAYAGDIVAMAKLKKTGINDSLADSKLPVVFAKIDFPEPVVDYSIKTETRKDQEKLGNAFSKILSGDPTIRLHMDPEFNQTIIKGMGDVHIDITMSRMKERYGVEAKLDKPLIPYRETIKGKSEAMFRHKKQTGGAGQFGEVSLKVVPLARGAKFEFVDDIFGGAIPRQFIPSCEKGIIDALKEGVLAGYPVVDVQATVFDGKYHPVDSKDIAFQIASRTAFKMAMEKAKPILLEPIMIVEITVPDKYTGDVTGSLNQRRGRILGIEVMGEFQIIKAEVPQAEMYGYSGDLRSMTQGTGYYTMTLSHYEEVPAFMADKIIEEAKKRREELREKSA